jgi:hypothetical protein
MRLVWAEAIGLAALLLLGSGYGEAWWAARGVSLRRVVGVGAGVWAAGAVVPDGVDVGLVLLSLCAGAWLWRRWPDLRRAAVWGAMAAAVRAFAPIDPYQATVVPAVGIEAVLLGLVATVGAADPPTAGAVAVGAAAFAEVCRWLFAGPGTAGGGPTAWLYALTAAVTAFAAAAAGRRLPRRVTR